MNLDPAIYEHWRATHLGQVTENRERELIEDLLGPVDGRDLLDVGCGDGDFALSLYRRGARVTGVDSASAMIKAARRRAKTAHAQISFEQANARALPFPPASFDKVVSVTLLCFLDNAAGAVREMVRVLRPGGTLVIGELGKWSLWAAQRRLRGWLGDEIWRDARFRTAKELTELVREAGLEPDPVRGAVYYPPLDWAARWILPKEQEWSELTTAGAAFLALSASRSKA